MNDDYPKMTEQINNFFSSVKNHIVNRMENVSQEIQQGRINICLSCDKFDPNGIRCKECGCFLSIKTSWASEKCPLDKWKSVENTLEQIEPEQAVIIDKKNCGCGQK